MRFLKGEVEGEERLQLARTSFDDVASKEKRGNFKGREFRTPTAAALFSSKEYCIFCNKNHNSRDCIAARSIPLKERINKVQEKKCCLKCLKVGHFAKFCKIFVKCHVCSKNHTELLCPDIKRESPKKTETTEVVQSTIANAECSTEVALMTLEVEIIGGNKKKKVRALLDCGSQKSYILKSTAKELNLKSNSTEHIVHTLFGGSYTESKPHNKFLIKLGKPNSNIPMEFEFLDQEIICGKIPRVPKYPLIKELKKHKIWLTDIGPGSPKIELLIGSNIYGKILTGKVKQLQSGMTAIQTKLGWAACGPLKNYAPEKLDNTTTVLATHMTFQVPQLWQLDTIGILDPAATLSKREEEELAHDHFIKDVNRNEEGRYSVGLPWTDSHPDIPSNRHIVEKRLFYTTRKLKSLNKLEDYNKVFLDWEEEGIIEKVPEAEIYLKSHYLPHHPVIKPESSTTKIRPVFDASCKSGRSPSLNDCLMKGPNLIEEIPTILLRFREKPIGVIADIRKAFLQIEIKESDRDYLRFLWWKNNNKVQVYRHNRVVFGVTCSPFLLEAVIRHHLSNVSQDLTPIAEKLLKSFYIDNCVTSVNNEQELEEFIIKSTDIFSMAKMDLRMWEFGPHNQIDVSLIKDKSLLKTVDSTTPVPVLGLRWDKHEDNLMIGSKVELKVDNPSKREILSITQSIFDPIGFLAPVLLPAKLLVQEAWSIKSNWDDPLPDNIRESFIKWYNELNILNDLKIPRRIGFGDKIGWTIHVFCDASQKAYATAIFLRCEDQNNVSVQLIAAKSRLAPLKRITIPRLELLACVLGVRLYQYILEGLTFPSIPVYFWSDSSTSLAWIRRNDQWGTFVGNRVREICKLSNPSQWHFVPGDKNPSDLPSRGCNPVHLVNSRWWEGPEWLRDPKVDWAHGEIPPDEEEISAERRKVLKVNINLTTEEPKWYQRISKFSRIVRVLAWVRRFIRNARKQSYKKDKILSASEIEEAENSLWWQIQKISFPQLYSKDTSAVKGLVVMRDNKGLFRVKTKIIDREDEFSFRYPLLLPAKHHVVKCLILEYHLNNCHAGVQILASKLRENFWIISSKRMIRSVISKCARCKRFTAKARSTSPIQLPRDRVRDAAVYEITGIDLCGPFILKNKRKAWCVLFTCAVYRAVHLEVVTALSTETFIQALRRFIARRGRPRTIYTDNGTNFRGTNNLLKELHWEKIQASDTIHPIKWKFIPPTAAWWGGWWERLIRSVKTLLVRILGRASLHLEELITVLCDVEATLNSRPLTFVSDGTDNLTPLTPAMFIQDIAESGTPDLDIIDNKKLQLRYNYCQKLREELRSRFRKEYLSQLVQKANITQEELKLGDIVLVGLDNQKRINWPMARIIKFLPSRDQKARVAEVKTQNGTLIRPLPKLYPLEVTDSDHLLSQQQKVSRSGRLLKPPDRLLY